MTTIRDYLAFSWLAEASYVRFRNVRNALDSRDDLSNEELRGYFAASQSSSLLSSDAASGGANLGYEGLHHVDISGSGPSGFSATLFRDTVGQRYVLAIRGTDFPSGLVDDVIDADLSGIALSGIAGSQFADLLIYIRQLNAPGGQAVTFSDEEVRQLARLRNSDNYYDPRWQTYLPRPIEELRAQFAGIVGIGEPGEAALLGDAPFVVVGHSLGGHLASLAGAYFGSRVTEVVTFNAPGFIAGRFAELLGVPLGPMPSTTNVEAYAGIELTAGYRGRTGSPLEIFTEDQGVLPNPIANHSILYLSNSIAVAELLSRIDPNLQVSTFNRLMEEASVQENRSEEAVVELVLRLLGSESIVATDNRAALMDAIQTAHGLIDSVSGGLGPVTIRSLSELTAVQVEALFATDEGVRYAVLNGNTIAFSGLAYTGALAVAPAVDFSAEFVRDRVHFVLALGNSHSMNLGEVQGGGEGSQAYMGLMTYEWRSGSELRALRPLGYELLEESQALRGLQAVVFGSDAADIVVASDDAPSGGYNRLYGLDGDDTLYGGVGDDLLDGGDGLDAYYIVPGEGRDTILDADRRGALWVRIGETWRKLTGEGERIDDVTWIDEALDVSYFFDGASLIIEVGGSTITVRGWQPDSGAPTLRAHRESDDGRVGMQAVSSGSMLGISRPDYAVDQLPQAPAYSRIVSVGSGYGASGGQATTGADTLYGDGANDSFRLGAGNDFASTLDDSDRVDGEDGDDTLRGDGGDDVVIGGAGLDVLLGGTGNDRLYASAETTRSDATAPANQPAATGARGEYLDGNLGNDTLVGAGGNDLLLAGEGEDWVFGSSGNDTVYGDRSTFDNRVNIDTGGGTARWSLSRSQIAGAIKHRQICRPRIEGTKLPSTVGPAGHNPGSAAGRRRWTRRSASFDVRRLPIAAGALTIGLAACAGGASTQRVAPDANVATATSASSAESERGPVALPTSRFKGAWTMEYYKWAQAQEDNQYMDNGICPALLTALTKGWLRLKGDDNCLTELHAYRPTQLERLGFGMVPWPWRAVDPETDPTLWARYSGFTRSSIRTFDFDLPLKKSATGSARSITVVWADTCLREGSHPFEKMSIAGTWSVSSGIASGYPVLFGTRYFTLTYLSSDAELSRVDVAHLILDRHLETDDIRLRTGETICTLRSQ